MCEIYVDEGTSSVIVGVLYRSPNSGGDNNQNLYSCFNKLATKRVVIFGDFNFPDIDWRHCTSGPHGKDFLEVVSDCFFTQHVLFPTRGNNCLDLVFSSEVGMIDNVNSGGKLGASDHDLISFDLCCFNKVFQADKLVLDFSKLILFPFRVIWH